MKWSVFALGDILSLEYGAALPEKNRDVDGKVPVAGSNGIAGYHSQALVKGPGIVIGRKGSAGKVNWFDTDFWAIDTTFYVRLKAPANMRWIFYLLKQLKLDRLSIVTGVPGLSRNDAYCLKVPLPPLSEQRRIVEILEQADALRKKRAEADAKAERILPALFIKMFGDPVTNPKGWKLVTLQQGGAYVRYGLGQPPKASSSGVPLLRATNINHGTIREADMMFVDPKAVPETRNAFLSPDEVLVVRSGAYTGDVAQVTEKWTGAVAGYDLVVTPGDKFCGEYVEAHLLTPHVQKNYFGNLKVRAGQPHLNASQLSETPIFQPPKELQEKFARYVRSIRRLQERCRQSQQQLNDLFTLLLQHAFSGELTARWREGHMTEIIAEMEQKTKILGTTAELHYEQLALIETRRHLT